MRRLTRRHRVQRLVERVQIHRDVPTAANARDRTDVIQVRVRQPDRFGYRARFLDGRDQQIRLRAGIDDRAAIGGRLDDEIAVLLKCADRQAGDRARSLRFPFPTSGVPAPPRSRARATRRDRDARATARLRARPCTPCPPR